MEDKAVKVTFKEPSTKLKPNHVANFTLVITASEVEGKPEVGVFGGKIYSGTKTDNKDKFYAVMPSSTTKKDGETKTFEFTGPIDPKKKDGFEAFKTWIASEFEKSELGKKVAADLAA